MLQLFNRERRSARGIRPRSTATTWTPTRTPSRPMAGSIRWWNSSPCWHSRRILAYGGLRIESGRLSLGMLVAFLQYGLRFFRPIQDLSEKYNILQGAMAVVRAHLQAARYAGDHPVRRRRRNPPPTGHRRHRIRPRVVRLQRRGLGAARRQLHHRARRNPRGGGPHGRRQDHAHQPAAALLRCAERRDPRRRRRHPRSRSARFAAHFGVVLQDPFLFTGTIDENIRLGTERIRDEDVESAAEQVNVLDFIRSLPDGFDSRHPRARQRTFHRPEAVDQLCPRPGARSALPDSRRSHVERRY